MNRFFEKIVVLFLLSIVVILLLVIVCFMDFTGFVDFRSSLPDSLKKNKVVAEYISRAEINAKAPMDQQAILIDEKKQYVETLLKKMKLESGKILEEKERLEALFRQFEEDKKVLAEQRKAFMDEVERDMEARRLREDQDFQKRLDGLAVMYAKMDPAAAAKVLDELSPQLSLEVLKRLKPKSLGTILQQMPPKKASSLVQTLQSQGNMPIMSNP